MKTKQSSRIESALVEDRKREVVVDKNQSGDDESFHISLNEADVQAHKQHVPFMINQQSSNNMFKQISSTLTIPPEIDSDQINNKDVQNMNFSREQSIGSIIE